MTETLRPGALYTYQPDESTPILVTEVLTVGGAHGVAAVETLSTDGRETAALIDADVFGPTGTYVHVGDVRDHQNNPDVGDVFLMEIDGAGWDVVEIVSVDEGWATVLMTWSVDGHQITETYAIGTITELGAWTGTTRPVFDTPERYTS